MLVGTIRPPTVWNVAPLMTQFVISTETGSMSALEYSARAACTHSWQPAAPSVSSALALRLAYCGSLTFPALMPVGGGGPASRPVSVDWYGLAKSVIGLT